MSLPTPVSRRTSTNSLFSPPTSLANTRRASHASSSGSPRVGTPSSAAGSDRKKRTRDLLRDYYGLGSEGKKVTASPTPDALDIDNPATFVPEAYFRELSQKASLPELLKREEELISEIRELDGERQSIVYNHHHELIEASDTIRKMKSRAEALDTSLEALKASLESISQLSTSLVSNRQLPRPARPPLNAPPLSPSATAEPATPTRQRRLPTLEEDPTTPTPTRPRSHSAVESTFEAPPVEARFDPLQHLPALLSLPVLLRALINEDRKTADSLWGEWEPTLRQLEEEHVEGIREIGMECRDVLKRRRANSNAPRPDSYHVVVK
ncbi:hypothetical protein OIV83_000479 [Microbotryomycetes sp. JL201]|nr:hypothetical protein OIV83_000479 [Microbotryomycetes sp. JL201]